LHKFGFLERRRFEFPNNVVRATEEVRRNSAAFHYAEARNIVDLIRDDAARAPIKLHKVRRDVSILEGSGGNIVMLTVADGKVFIDAPITASRPRILEAANSLSRDPIRHLINTHWHFDHANGDTWLNAEEAAIIAHEKRTSISSSPGEVEEWDYTFPPSPLAAVPTEVFSSDMTVACLRMLKDDCLRQIEEL
jgi:glyoxylase-like metal-dependent hydrolase (beta-lactamase superfamily II)